MHKSLTGLLIIWYVAMIGSSAFPQVPEKMSYQAVIRNSQGALVAGQPWA